MKIILALATLLLPCTARADCTFTVSPMSFGAYDSFAVHTLDSTATISYSCGLAILPTLSASTGGSGTFSSRAMAGPGGNLLYNVYVDSSRKLVFGDGTNNTSAIQFLIATSGTVTIYGSVFARQNLHTGSYGDSLTLTLLF